MSRRNRTTDLSWRDITRNRDSQVDELAEVLNDKVVAKEYGKQVGVIFTTISSPGEEPETAGAQINKLTGMVIDMLRIMSENAAEYSSSSSSGEALARATEQYNRQLTVMREENEGLRRGLVEARQLFEVASADQARLLQALEQMRVERDRALERAKENRVVNNNNNANVNVDFIRADNARLIEENEKLKKRVKKQQRRLQDVDEAVMALEEADREERKARRKQEKRNRKK